MKKQLFLMIMMSCASSALAMDLQSPQEELNAQLHRALEEDSVNEVQRALAAGAGLYSTNRDGGTAVSKAVQKGNSEVIELFLAVQLNLEAKLRSASSDGNIDEVKRLIREKASANTVGPYTPLTLAASNGHLAVCKVLLEAKANVNLVGYAFDRKPALTCAASSFNKGAFALVKLFLDAGADQALKDGIGETALLAAACWPTYEREEICKLLVRHQKMINDGLVATLLCLRRMKNERNVLGQVLYEMCNTLLLPYLETKRYVPITKLLNFAGENGKRPFDHLQIDCLNPLLINRPEISEKIAPDSSHERTAAESESGWSQYCSIQ